MKKRAAIYLFGTILFVLIATVRVVTHPRFEGFLRPIVEREVAAKLHAKVRIDHLQIRLLSFQPGIELYDVKVWPRYPNRELDEEPSFQASTVRVVLRPLQLRANKIDIDRVELEDPHFDLLQRDGKWIGLPTGIFASNEGEITPSPEDALDIRLDAFLLKNGTFHFFSQDPPISVGIEQARALGTLEPNGSVVVDLAAKGRRISMRVGEDRFEEFIEEISGQLVVDSKSLEIKGAQIETDALSAEVDGKIALTGAKTNVQLTHLVASVPLEWVERITPDVPAMKGRAEFQGALSYIGTNLRTRGTIRIDDYWLQDFHFGATEADVEVAGDRAVATRLVIEQGSGRIGGTGELAFPESGVTLACDLDVQQVQFARVLDMLGISGSHVDMVVDGKVAFAGPVAPMNISGTADLAHTAFTWRDRPWFTGAQTNANLRVLPGRIGGGFVVSPEGIEFDELRGTAGSANIALDGSLWFRGATDLSFALTPVSLGELSPIAGGVVMRGTGPASGRISGDLDKIVVEADMDLEGMNVVGFDFGRGTGSIRFSVADFNLSSPHTTFVRGKSTYEGPWKLDFSGTPSLAFDVTTEGARVEDLADIVFADVKASQFAQGNVSGRIQLAGPFDALSGTYKASGTDLAVVGERFATYRAAGRWKQGDIWLDDLVATKKSGGSLFIRGSLGLPPDGDKDGLGGAVNVEVHTSKLLLADLDAVGPDSAVASDLALRLHLGGRFYRPELRGRVDLNGTKVNGQPLGASQIDFETVPMQAGGPKEVVSLDANLAGGTVKGGAKVHLKAMDQLPYEATFVATRHSLKPYLQPLNARVAKDEEIKASTTGTFKLHGDVWKLTQSEIDVTANELSLARGPHRVANDGPILVSLGGDRVELRQLKLLGDETDLSVWGRRGGGKSDFNARGKIDLVFAELATDVFSRVEGVLHVRALRYLGDGEETELTGSLEIESGTFKTRFFPIGPEEVRGKIRIDSNDDGTRIILEKGLAGRIGGGTFECDSSDIVFTDRGVRYGIERVKLDDVNMRFPGQGLTARLSGNLGFVGTTASGNVPELNGDLWIDELRFTAPLDWKAQLVNFRPQRAVSAVGDADARMMRFGINLKANDNLWVRNELVNIEFKTVDPHLRLVGDNVAWGIVGAIEPVRGRITFQGKDFTVTSGRIDFMSQKEIDLAIKLEAETFIRDWLIKIKPELRTSRGDLYVKTESQPPLPPEDINMLIIAGLTAQEAKSQGQEAAVAAALVGTTVGQGLGEQRGLSSRLKSFVQLDAVDVVPTYSEGGGIGFKAVGRKTLTPDLSISGAVGHSDRVTGNVQADYRVSKRLHVVGGWNNEDSRDGTASASEQQLLGSQGDWSVDAKFRFEWK